MLLAAAPDDLNQVHELLLEVWRQAPEVPENDRVCFETALIELAANVIRHAGRGIGVRCRLSIEVTPDEVAAITAPKREVTLTATGARLRPATGVQA